LNGQLTRASTLATPAATSPLMSNTLHTTGVSISLSFKIPTSNSKTHKIVTLHSYGISNDEEKITCLLKIGQQISTDSTTGFL